MQFCFMKMERVDVNYRVMKLREELGDVFQHDFRRTDGYLVRWLTVRKLGFISVGHFPGVTLRIKYHFIPAHNNNVTRAKRAILQSLEWRRVNVVDGILTEDLRDSAQLFPLTTYGTDSDGRPITYANVGIWDTYNNRNGFRYMVQWLETVEAAIKTQALETDGLVNQGIFILDMKGMTLNFFRPACFQFFIRIIRIYDQHYPEMGYTGFFINAPSYLKFWIKILKPFMSRHARSRLRIYDRNSKRWRDALMQIIKPQELVNILTRCQKEGSESFESKEDNGLPLDGS